MKRMILGIGCILLGVFVSNGNLDLFVNNVGFIQLVEHVSSSEFSQVVSSSSSRYQVKRVIDGDTIVVQNGEEIEKVRLLGIDTPELAHNGHGQECFAREATQFLRKYLEGKKVLLVGDKTQKNKDTYGRLLRYVEFPSKDMSVNRTLLVEGYGFEYTYNIAYERQNSFKSAQRNARQKQRGLWSPRNCQGVYEGGKRFPQI